MCTNRIVAQSNKVIAAPNCRAVTWAAWSIAVLRVSTVSARAIPIAANISNEKIARDIENQVIGAIYWIGAEESEKT